MDGGSLRDGKKQRWEEEEGSMEEVEFDRKDYAGSKNIVLGRNEESNQQDRDREKREISTVGKVSIIYSAERLFKSQKREDIVKKKC